MDKKDSKNKYVRISVHELAVVLDFLDILDETTNLSDKVDEHEVWVIRDDLYDKFKKRIKRR